jgi:hypothetical protein
MISRNGPARERHRVAGGPAYRYVHCLSGTDLDVWVAARARALCAARCSAGRRSDDSVR